LDEAKKTLESNKEKLKQFLPELEAAFNSIGDKPKVRFFEGVEGVKNLREDLAGTIKSTKSDFFEIFSHSQAKVTEEELGLDPDQKNKIIRKMLEQTNSQHVIYTGNDEVPEWEGLESQNLEFYRIPAENFPVKVDITIYANKIAITGERSGILIEDKDIATTMISLFKLSLSCLKNNKEEKYIFPSRESGEPR
jgi:hypothetical protein